MKTEQVANLLLGLAVGAKIGQHEGRVDAHGRHDKALRRCTSVVDGFKEVDAETHFAGEQLFQSLVVLIADASTLAPNRFRRGRPVDDSCETLNLLDTKECSGESWPSPFQIRQRPLEISKEIESSMTLSLHHHMETMRTVESGDIIWCPSKGYDISKVLFIFNLNTFWFVKCASLRNPDELETNGGRIKKKMKGWLDIDIPDLIDYPGARSLWLIGPLSQRRSSSSSSEPHKRRLLLFGTSSNLFRKQVANDHWTKGVLRFNKCQF